MREGVREGGREELREGEGGREGVEGGCKGGREELREGEGGSERRS